MLSKSIQSIFLTLKSFHKQFIHFTSHVDMINIPKREKGQIGIRSVWIDSKVVGATKAIQFLTFTSKNTLFITQSLEFVGSSSIKE